MLTEVIDRVQEFAAGEDEDVDFPPGEIPQRHSKNMPPTAHLKDRNRRQGSTSPPAHSSHVFSNPENAPKWSGVNSARNNVVKIDIQSIPLPNN